MPKSNSFQPGKHFLQIPGPTNVPDRVLRAMDYPTIDHRGPDFADLAKRVLDRIKLIFKTSITTLKIDHKKVLISEFTQLIKHKSLTFRMKKNSGSRPNQL